MSVPEALSPRGPGFRKPMDPALRDAWSKRLEERADAVQQAAAALESDVEEALRDGCHPTWISATTGLHFVVVQRIRDEGPARSWQHPQRFEA